MMWIYTDEKLPTPGKMVEVAVVEFGFCYTGKGFMDKNGAWWNDETDKPFHQHQRVYSYRNYTEVVPPPLKKDK
jgi:hypothetical protein